MIEVGTTIKIAFRSLRVNKMRSILTSLGIIIGVAAVIIMISIGTGASQQISKQISSMGSNIIIVMSGATSSGGARMGSGSQPTLTINDAEAIKKDCPSVAMVAPNVAGVAQVIFSNQNWSTSVTGTTPGMLEIREWPMKEGRNFTEQDVENATKVCLLGQTVITNLFGDLDPIGKIIKIKNIPFIVIGTLESKGQSAGGQDQDDTIFIPITTAQKKVFGTPFPGAVRFIMVKAKDEGSLDKAETQITALLQQRHHIRSHQDDDFSIRNLTQTMQMAQQSSNVMTFLLGSIASVSLLVGGIGIMNIMLVSVTERTKEIGIRMAVGAKKWDIRIQFLAEAILLSLGGGIIGIIIGVTGSNLVSRFSEWPTEISITAIILSFAFSGIVGIFFGFYPAYKASLLNPIDALRYE